MLQLLNEAFFAPHLMEIKVVKAIDGTIAVQRGPLVYALNIPAEKTFTRSYPLKGFYDIDFKPSGDACWDYILKIDDNYKHGFKVHKTRLTGDINPWDTAPVRIECIALDWTGQTGSNSVDTYRRHNLKLNYY